MDDTKTIGVKNGTLQEIKPEEADYSLPSNSRFFSTHINLIPLHNDVPATRLFYGARFYNQSLPLDNPEAPLVQSLDDQDANGRSFDEIAGDMAGNVRAEAPGRVRRVDKNYVVVDEGGKDHKYELYNNFPLNRKTALHNSALVKAGDEVTPGHLLARSNYTDKNGTLAMGVNARVAVVPYMGWTMDDAIAVSQSFAQRLKSEHLVSVSQRRDRELKGGKSHFTSLFPTKFKVDQLKNLDDDGVATVGAIIQPGDPLVLATKPKVISSATAQLGNLSRINRQARSDATEVWDHDQPGEVTDVSKTRHGVKVNVRTMLPAEEGDKLSNRSGNKGVISKIIPDHHMPRTSDGRPLDVLANPLGFVSRANASGIYELLLGKVAAKTGKPIKVPTFNKPGEHMYDQASEALKAAGLTDKEQVYDPLLDRTLDNPVTVGNAYMLKLHHTSKSKKSARGQGAYDSAGQPLKGGGAGEQSKRLSGLESSALMSSGAYAVLREGATLRGAQNDDYWRKLREGQTPAEPGHPFAWDKFQALIQGTGLNAKALPDGKLRLGPMTDKDVDAMDPLEIKNGELVDLKTMAPVPGGLFDESLSGSNKWGKIPLPFRVPNPAFEDTICKLLGVTKKDFRSVIAGEKTLAEVQ